MKKFLIFFVLVAILFLTFGIANAQQQPPFCDESKGGGLVPCGRNIDPKTGLLLCPCQIYHIWQLIANVYRFIVWWSIPLAILFITIGGVVIMISGGPGGVAAPNLYNTGRRIVWGAIIGLVLVFTSWVIIFTVLRAIGYNGPF